MTTSPSDALAAASPETLDALAVRQIVADIERMTIGRRRVDIAHAALNVVAQEIALNAASPAAVKHAGQVVAKQLKELVRDVYARRQRARSP